MGGGEGEQNVTHIHARSILRGQLCAQAPDIKEGGSCVYGVRGLKGKRGRNRRVRTGTAFGSKT